VSSADWLRDLSGHKALGPLPLFAQVFATPIYAYDKMDEFADLGQGLRPIALFPAADKDRFLLFPTGKSGAGSVGPLSLSKHTVDGKTLAVLDVLPYLSGSLGPIFAESLAGLYVLGDPSSLACDYVAGGATAQGAIAGLRQGFANGLTITPTDVGQSTLMFLRKSGGTTELNGAYVIFRSIYNADGLIDYSHPRIPRDILYDAGGGIADVFQSFQMCVMEIGVLENGVFTPQRQRLVPGVGFSYRAGLARRDIGSSQGTVFCVNAVSAFGSVCPLAFAFVPASTEHVLIAVCPVNPAANAITGWPFSSAGRGFSAAWPRALWLRDSDHASLVEVAWRDGAVASTRHPDLLSRFAPLGAEWEAWQQSQFPATIHGCKTTTRDFGATVDSLQAIPEPPAVVWAERKYQSRDAVETETLQDRWQSHPVSVVEAKAAALQTLIPTHFDENAAYLLDQPGHGQFVFNGKKLTKLTIEFTPYLSTSKTVPTGQFEQSQQPSPETTITGNTYTNPVYQNDHTIDSNSIWKASGGQPIPSGGSPLGFVISNTNYSGTRISRLLASATPAITAAMPAGDVTASAESQALLSLSRSSIGQSLPVASGLPAYFEFSNPRCAAPPTGSYDLEQFEIGSVASAPGVLRYIGDGEWSASKTFEVTQYTSESTIDSTWQRFFTTDSYLATSTVTTTYKPVIATQQIELSADHVEMYAFLGSQLQEAGTYAVRPDVLNGATEEQVRDFDHDVITQPKGQLRSVVDYVAGNEPHAVLRVTLFVRTAMRASATVGVDSAASQWPYSFTNSDPEPYNSSVVGLNGAGTLGVDVMDTHHPYIRFDYTFTRQQTLSLLAGQSVSPTQWQTGNANTPLPGDFRSPYFQHRMAFSAVFEDLE
jgi:hypothetical protein